MSLTEAVQVLARFRHCDTAEWGIARDGYGQPHAFGAHRNERRQFTGISLSADDAVRVAAELQGDA